MEEGRDIKGEKEGVEQERRKERKKVLKERKSNNKELLNPPPPNKPAGFKLAKPDLLGFLAAAG